MKGSIKSIRATVLAEMWVFGLIGGRHCLSGHDKGLLAKGVETIVCLMDELPKHFDI